MIRDSLVLTHADNGGWVMRDIKTDTISPVLVIEYFPRALSWRGAGEGAKRGAKPLRITLETVQWQRYNGSGHVIAGS